MKVSIDWLKELAEINIKQDKLPDLISLRTQGGVKELTNQYIELDLKGYNRADLLALRGVAFEIAAITDSKVKFKEPEKNEYVWVNKNLAKTPGALGEEKLNANQGVPEVDGLEIDKAPENWIKKLESSGMRSVNNIADITNLIMLEYGQPLHAFDAATVKDDAIITRRAKKDEEIVTLDGKVRKLSSEDIVLADEEKSLDVAGVMGGKDTEVKESTITILLSASLFNAQMVRVTSQKLKLASEASKRFYHGLTKKRLFQSLDAAIRLYESIGGKLTALNIVGDTEDQGKKIPLSLKKINRLIGISIESAQVEGYLRKLNFELKEEKNQEGEPAWVVTPPYYRLDIEIEEDLIEEVARMYGYEKIPAKELKGELPKKVDQSFFDLIRKVKNALVEIGLSEIQTYSYFSTKVLDNFGWNEENNKDFLVKIVNPISKETEYLRQNLWSNLLEAASENLKYFDEIAVFEVGKIFFPQTDEKPMEEHTLSILLVNNTNNPLAQLNQIYLKLNETLKLGLEKSEDRPVGPGVNLFHPKRFLRIRKDQRNIGGLAEVHPRIVSKFGIEKRVTVLEISLEKLL